jgi:hypothetical protein
MNNMLEEFITVALEAFTNASGDVDKFELQLRRKLMTYTSTNPGIIPQPRTAIPQVGIAQVEKAMTNISQSDPIFSELEQLDVHNMTDEDVLEFAKRLGIMGNDEVSLLQQQEDE